MRALHRRYGVEVKEMNSPTRIVSAIVVVGLLALVSAASAGQPTRTLKHVGRPVAAVAMDGARVAYVSDDDAVHAWNIQTGAVTQLRPGAGHYMDHPIVPEVAIAGTRTAWISVTINGNSRETTARLFTRSLTGRSRGVATAFRSDGYYGGDVELWNGNWLTGLVGSQGVLAVSRWTTKTTLDDSQMVVSNERLSLIDASGRLRTIVAGPNAITSAAASPGRIAVLRQSGSIGMYSPAGKLVREIRPSSAHEIAFGGGRLLVLTNTRTLEVYDAGAGTLLHSWPIHTSSARMHAGNLSVYGRLGLYMVDPRALAEHLHLVDLATGRELVLPVTHHVWGARDSVLGPLGLVYPVNTYRFGAHPQQTGTLVFVPTARVLAMIAAS
jgi:hypothetical protein